MSKTTYEKFNSAFSLVAAYAIMYKHAHVANITFKFPAKGEGKLNAFVHWIGSPLQTGSTSGYGYDKRKAAWIRSQYRFHSLMWQETRELMQDDAFLTELERLALDIWGIA